MTKTSAIVALLLATFLGPAQAKDDTPELGWYLGLGGGYSLLEPDLASSGFLNRDNTDFGWKLFGGYHITNAIAVEAEYADLGTAKLDPWGEVDYQILTVSGLYYFFERGNPLTLGWSLFARGGAAKIFNQTDVPQELDHPLSLHYGFGAAFEVNRNWSVRVDTTTYDDDAAFTGASVVYYFTGKPAPAPAPVMEAEKPGDLDLDGVADPDDKCPDTPVGATVDAKGCEPDTDMDGVIDREDRCPGTPAGSKVDQFGCIPDEDIDDDGVLNDKDKCPDTAIGVKVGEDGCDLDPDKDGVPRPKDKCPDTPPGVRVNADGCDADPDKDGVPTPRDKCPDTPAGVKVDVHGCDADPDRDGVLTGKDKCPDTPRGVKVNKDGCAAFQTRMSKVHFKSGSAELSRDAQEILKAVAADLQEIPGVKLEIQAHTDSVGKDRANLKLSQRRAESVLVFLLNQGINPDRLKARGYGESRPVDTNDTPKGRANNRRVEMRAIQ